MTEQTGRLNSLILEVILLFTWKTDARNWQWSSRSF